MMSADRKQKPRKGFESVDFDKIGPESGKEFKFGALAKVRRSSSN